MVLKQWKSNRYDEMKNLVNPNQIISMTLCTNGFIVLHVLKIFILVTKTFKLTFF